MILDKIMTTKNKEVAIARKKMPLTALIKTINEMNPCRDFKAAISGSTSAIIAEVKCASPSRGRLVEHFDPLKIAATYEQNGAAAISVLTDEEYFLGDKKYLTQIKTQVQLPLLRKDFIIAPYQVYESRAIGADAVLLIVRILGTHLREFIILAKQLSLATLTEVHTAAELEIALAAGADIIGINNRNLDTFVTDINTCKELARFIPAGTVTVAESGIRGRKDIENIMRSGVSAFLIGEALVTAADIGKRLREFRGEQSQ
jgi:indole-3-glycerol phosphate synthase